MREDTKSVIGSSGPSEQIHCSSLLVMYGTKNFSNSSSSGF